MLLNYLKLSLRLMARSPFFTLINVFGLGIGFASFFALWDYSTNELRADQYHKDFERIARIGMYWKWTDDGKAWDYNTNGVSQSYIPMRAKEDFAEVRTMCAFIYNLTFLFLAWFPMVARSPCQEPGDSRRTGFLKKSMLSMRIKTCSVSFRFPW